MRPRPNSTARTEDFEFATLEQASNYRRALIAAFRPHLHGRILEAGAGIGQMTRELLTVDTIGELVSLEPEARFAERLRAFRPARNVFEGVSADLPQDEPWDAVVSINVLEHIEDDEGELARYRHMLAPRGGHLCLFVPARPELHSDMDRDLGHHRRYTKRELRRKLSEAGFRSATLQYYNLTGYFAWLLLFRLLRRRKFSRLSVRLFDKVFFPPAHWFETRVCPPPFGQNLLAIAQA